MDTQVRIAGIIKESIVDGPGIRYVVFAQGCKHKCPGCHNPETHSFEGGNLIEIDEIYRQIKSNPLLDGITLSGGEPFEQAAEFIELALKVKDMGLNIMIYSGFTYEEITESISKFPERGKLLKLADILVDGPFLQNEKDFGLKFKGSKNQRIIDLKRTRELGTVILADI